MLATQTWWSVHLSTVNFLSRDTDRDKNFTVVLTLHHSVNLNLNLKKVLPTGPFEHIMYGQSGRCRGIIFIGSSNNTYFHHLGYVTVFIFVTAGHNISICSLFGPWLRCVTINHVYSAPSFHHAHQSLCQSSWRTLSLGGKLPPPWKGHLLSSYMETSLIQHTLHVQCSWLNPAQCVEAIKISKMTHCYIT